MATELLKLELDGLQKFDTLTSEMVARAQDLSPAFEAGDEAFRAEMNEQFETQGAYLQGGDTWAPLSPEYAKRKPKPPAPFGILYRSGDLWKSLSEEGGDHVKIVQPDSGTYGSSIPYGKYHQTGGDKLPQRKIIIVRTRLKAFMARAALGWILRGKTPGGGA